MNQYRLYTIAPIKPANTPSINQSSADLSILRNDLIADGYHVIKTIDPNITVGNTMPRDKRFALDVMLSFILPIY